MMKSVDYVIINELELALKIGCLEKEREIPQAIVVSIKFGVPQGLAARTQLLSDSVCYATASSLLKDLAKQQSWQLLETFLEDTAQLFFEHFPNCLTVNLQARKFVIPEAKWVGVELERIRKINT